MRLRAAEDVATEELQQFLASKREWVYRKLAGRKFVQHEPVTKGSWLTARASYLGRSYRSCLRIEAATSASNADGWSCLNVLRRRATRL